MFGAAATMRRAQPFRPGKHVPVLRVIEIGRHQPLPGCLHGDGHDDGRRAVGSFHEFNLCN